MSLTSYDKQRAELLIQRIGLAVGDADEANRQSFRMQFRIDDWDLIQSALVRALAESRR